MHAMLHLAANHMLSGQDQRAKNHPTNLLNIRRMGSMSVPGRCIALRVWTISINF